MLPGVVRVFAVVGVLAAVVVAVEGGSGSSCAQCSFAGVCHGDAAGAAAVTCTCAPGWRGATCATLDNQTVPVNGGFRLAEYYVWGSQVMRGQDRQFHMMASVYPKKLDGKTMDFNKEWLTNAQNVYATSPNATGPYTLQSFVLPYHNATVSHPQQYWDRSNDNPKFVQAHDGTYLLYYTGDTYDGPMPPDPHANTASAQASQRLGLAYATKPGGPYTRLPQPILEPRPGKWDSRMTTNIAVTVLPNGTIFGVYKASSPPGNAKQTQVCLGVVSAQHWKGPYVRLRDDPILPCPLNTFLFEDPTVWYDENHGAFHLLVKDFHGNVTHAGYSGAHATSTDGINWEFTQPALAYTTTHKWSDGKVRHQQRQERPQILLGDDGNPSHIFFATDTGLNGESDFFNMVLPLRPTA